MRKIYLLPVLLLALLAACKAQSPENKTDVMKKNEMVYLDELKNKQYTLKVGEKAYFSIDVHGSVGYWAEHAISNEQVVQLADTQTQAYNPENAGMPGGDKAKKTFIFEAKSAGKSDITIRGIFRSETDKEIIFQITVE